MRAQPPLFLIIAIVCAVLIVIGSIGPWAQVRTVFGTLSVSGMDGDGLLTLIGGLIAGALAGARLVRPQVDRVFGLIAAVVFGLVALGGIYDWLNVREIAAENSSQFASASVGWGLQLVTVAAVAGAVAGVLAFMNVGEEPVSDAAAG